MKIKIYQVDAFASKVFEGNPAAVCPLNEWLADDVLQKIAEENNLSETAFFVSANDGFQLRWFTPLEEVDLCGHATLASAHVIYQHLNYDKPSVDFYTKSGKLTVSKRQSGYSMNFPTAMPIELTTEVPADLVRGLNGLNVGKPIKVLTAFDYLLVLENEDDVKKLKPDFSKWLNLDLRGVIVTARGSDVDFVSRCFFPKLRVNEDPVTGSAHCELAPYWANILNKNTLTARQLSARSGLIDCEINEERIILSGNAVDFMVGEITI